MLRRIGIIIVLLVIPCSDTLAQGGQRSTRSAKISDVQVTVLATRIASSQDIQDYGLHPRAEHNVVLVFLRVKNVSGYPSCTHLDAWLHVKQGYEYPKSFGSKIKDPRIRSVLPTEESSGEFAFEIKAGTEASSLRLVRNAIGEDMCAEFQHRNTRISGPGSISLSLVGLPTKTGQSVAQVPPPAAPPAPPSDIFGGPQTSAPAVAQQEPEVEEQKSNVVLMKDGFEYRLVDYGVGRIQVRNQGRTKDFIQQVFWTKFQITNKAEHLIAKPRYFPSVLDALRVTDNWGNVYSLRYPNFTDVGGNWSGAELPIPGGSERQGSVKPNESIWAVRLIALDQFVGKVKELRIDLSNQFDYPKSYLKVEEPLSRHRDLLRNQADPKPDEISVKVVTERRVPRTR